MHQRQRRRDATKDGSGQPPANAQARAGGASPQDKWLKLAAVACGALVWLLAGRRLGPGGLGDAAGGAGGAALAGGARVGGANGAPPPDAPAHARNAPGPGLVPGDVRPQEQKHPPSADDNDDHEHTVHVALTFTLAHAVGALGVLNSTRSHASNAAAVRFHLMVPGADVPKVTDLVRVHFPGLINRKVYVVADRTKVGAKVHESSRSASLSHDIVYARYFFAATFPDLRRVIYLDTDVVVLGDILELWRTDMHGHAIAAVRRCRTRLERNVYFDKPAAAPHLTKFKRRDCVFNNGVMLYDLDAWRANPTYQSELVRWTELNAHTPVYSLGSQPPFNLVFYRDYFELDPAWNVMDAGEPSLLPNPDEVAAAKALHWNGLSKPWAAEVRTLLSEHFTRTPPDWEEIAQDEYFTVVIVTQGQRQQQLAQVLRHLSECALIYEVLLVWNNPDDKCPYRLIREAVAGRLDVQCLQQKENEMQNRLLIASHLETDAVLHYDDDVLVDISDLELGFRVWRRHRADLVGFQPRVHTKTPDGSWRYDFHLSEGYYTLVVGKCFFVSKQLMETYAADSELVALNRGHFCEDLAINLLAVRAGSAGCRLVRSNHRELPQAAVTGLSTSMKTQDWSALRRQCLSHLETASYFRPPFLANMPKSRRVVMGYSAHHNTLIERDVVRQESICSDTKGIKPCRVPSCQEALGRKPCYEIKS